MKDSCSKWFGFWREDNQYVGAPSVKDWVSPGCFDSDELRSNVLGYLANGFALSASSSKDTKCKICGEALDRSFGFITDGVWIWNNYLSHYIEKHSVGLPRPFLLHMQATHYRVVLPEVDDDETFIASLDWSMMPNGYRSVFNSFR